MPQGSQRRCLYARYRRQRGRSRPAEKLTVESSPVTAVKVPVKDTLDRKRPGEVIHDYPKPLVKENAWLAWNYNQYCEAAWGDETYGGTNETSDADPLPGEVGLTSVVSTRVHPSPLRPQKPVPSRLVSLEAHLWSNFNVSYRFASTCRRCCENSPMTGSREDLRNGTYERAVRDEVASRRQNVPVLHEGGLRT